MTWPQFKHQHSGIENEEISILWKKYKEGRYFIGESNAVKSKTEEYPRDEEEQKALNEAMELSKKLTRQQIVEEKKNRVGDEPENDRNLNTRIQLKYPDGSRTIRRFSKLVTLDLVRDFVDIEIITKELEIENYSLNLNFPKRTFRKDDEETKHLTLEEAGLHPQAVLFVQNLDA